MHDLKFGSVLKLQTAAVWRLNALETEHLKDVVEAFTNNIVRLDALLKSPAGLIHWAMKMQFCSDTAFVAVHGRLPKPGEKDDQYVRTKQIATDCWLKLNELQSRQPNYERTALEFGYSNLAEFSSSNTTLYDGAHVALTSAILSCWTAFETLCGDLWEAGLNHAPNPNALLRGSPRRIEKLAHKLHKHVAKIGKSQPELDKPNQTVSLADIAEATNFTFDLRNKAGTVLRQSFKFQTLSGIREAFSRAFDDDAAVDRILANSALDSLSAVRNLIVHKAGIADSEYRFRSKTLPKVPRPRKHKPITITGNTVVSLVNPVLHLACRLISAVQKRTG